MAADTKSQFSTPESKTHPTGWNTGSPRSSQTATANNSRAPSLIPTTEKEIDVTGNTNPPASPPAAPAIPEKSTDPATVRPVHGWKWFLTCLTIFCLAFLYGLDVTITADVQPDIIKTLGNIDKLAWIGAGFALGSVATILPIGYLYGMFEIKILYLTSIVLFETGSAICGGAPNMNALIVGRVIAGIGGSGMYLGCLNYISVFTTIREQNLYNALVGLVWGVGTVLGPLIGGGFAVSKVGWRWAFYINLLIAAVLAPVLLFYLPTNQPQPHRKFVAKLKTLDWIGTVLIMALYVTFTMAITAGGAMWAWNSASFIIMISFGGAILIAFVIQQYFCLGTTKELRLFPGQFLRSRTMILIYIGTSCGGTIMAVGAYFIPLLFQFAYNDSAIMAAVRLLPFMVVTIFFVMMNGALMPKYGYYMPWYFISGIFGTVGGSLMYTIKYDTPKSTIYGYSVLAAVGAGFALQAGYAVAAATVVERFKRPQEIPAAISFMNIAQLGSVLIAFAIAGSIFQNVGYQKVSQALSGYGLSEETMRSALAGTTSEFYTQATPAQRTAATNAIVKTIDDVFVLVLVAGAVQLLGSLFMRREKLFQLPVAIPTDAATAEADLEIANAHLAAMEKGGRTDEMSSEA